ncbi:MAG: type II toxin-antitoxin system Phd/YefM family antitoxin [Treponema sp.]|nr:type II toxin-antitoxin system Phd/YefM family antitoxin [Treponema sp.]
MNAIPIFEVKNKLPLFMHQAETSGPVFISRRNKTVGVLLSVTEYQQLVSAKPKIPFLDKAAEFRKKTAGLFSNDDIDLIFNPDDTESDTYESDVFEGVFKD